ncbi:MAG: VOC family protein [Burkholderiaceae bacterium]
MSAIGMNHFTILTNDLDATIAFYGRHLALAPGARPAFSFPGPGSMPRAAATILHVVAGRSPERLVPGVIDHMAFTGRGLRAALDRLEADGVAYDLRQLPGGGTWQLFFTDPNGARVELDFDGSETR